MLHYCVLDALAQWAGGDLDAGVFTLLPLLWRYDLCHNELAFILFHNRDFVLASYCHSSTTIDYSSDQPVLTRRWSSSKLDHRCDKIRNPPLYHPQILRHYALLAQEIFSSLIIARRNIGDYFSPVSLLLISRLSRNATWPKHHYFNLGSHIETPTPTRNT